MTTGELCPHLEHTKLFWFASTLLDIPTESVTFDAVFNKALARSSLQSTQKPFSELQF